MFNWFKKKPVEVVKTPVVNFTAHFTSLNGQTFVRSFKITYVSNQIELLRSLGECPFFKIDDNTIVYSHSLERIQITDVVFSEEVS